MGAKRKKPTKDPPIRKDNRCARFPTCKKERQPESQYAHTSEDPFCSSTCCRIYWGTEEDSGSFVSTAVNRLPGISAKSDS